MKLHFGGKKEEKQGGTRYFQNSRNTEVTELSEGLNSMKIEKQKDAMKQIIASMTIGKDVSMLFPQVVKCIRTKNVELKKLVYLYLINYAKIKPDMTVLAVASFNTDAKEGETPLIRGLAIRTMGCIRVPMIVSYLCETLTTCFKDSDAYVRKTAAWCVSKLFVTSSALVGEKGFISTLHDLLTDPNASVIANALTSLNEISVLCGKNQLSIKTKVLKRILQAIPEANEWGQVCILDSLILFTPKKNSQAEDIIEAVLPRLIHANPSVVMSGIKVIWKFMDHIDNIDKVRNYCKKISSSLMSVMMATPEIQYVLLMGLHGIVQKRPMLLDKDFKFFFIQYNDPIYVKLEKVDILYKWCENKNFEPIIKELTSYALTEINTELIQKSIKYIGFIGYKYEKSLDICVDSLKKIIDNNNEDALAASWIVSRDLLRKYKGRSWELIKKISIDLISSITETDSKAAAFYILGEFSAMIKDSTEIITHFVNTFSNAETAFKIKLQILNAAVKNFVNKPEEGEEIVKICLQKGAEESENPDVRDRAYIYWRLLETDPDIAKDMMVSEKPPFDFNDDDYLIDADTVDDLIDNMTNVSCIYMKKAKDMIQEEDMIAFGSGLNDEEEKESETKADKQKATKEEKSAKDSKKHSKKKKHEKKEEEPQIIADADLLGLDEDGVDNNNMQINSGVNNIQQSSPIPSNNTGGDLDNIFDIFGGGGSSSSPNPQQSMTNTFNTPQSTSIPSSLFQNSSNYPTTSLTQVFSSPTLSIYSQFQRSNQIIRLGLYFSSQQSNQCSWYFNKNSFGWSTQTSPSTSQITNSVAMFTIIINTNNNDMKPPQSPFTIDAMLNYNNSDINIKLPLDINITFVEGWKLSGQPFVEFFQKNKELICNQNTFTFSKITSEDQAKLIFDRNNIVLSARQNKANPPLIYYSASIAGAIPMLIETSFVNAQLNIKIIANHEAIVPLIKKMLDKIMN